MNESNHYVVFALEARQLALRLSGVERIVRAVEVTPLPGAPETVPGAINLQGRIVPVVNIRKRFGLLEREVDPSDQLIIVRSSRRTVALWVDAASKVIQPAEGEVVQAAEILPGMEHLEGAIKLPDGMILIHDLDRFLSLEEENTLDRAMEETAP